MRQPIGDFETEPAHAEWLDKDPRTLRHWRNEPDGLPYTTAGSTVLYKREWTLAWLEGRKRVRNAAMQPRRGRPRRAVIEAREEARTE